MKVSKKNIVSIWEFMENYFGVVYDDKYTLTHEEMNYYLKKKKKIFVRKINFNKIDREMILRGEVILVSDELGNVTPYVNPRKIDNLDVDEINATKRKIFSKSVDNFGDLKDIGKSDYEVYTHLKEKVLPKKERILRRGYE